MASVSSTFSDSGTDALYLPLTGLAAAMTAQRALSVVTMPALLMEMDCCSMASWMLVRSASFILSNSSMQHTPWSASTSAPPSNTHSRVSMSLCTDAVSPTALAPLPVVYTERCDVASTYLRNCDLAVPGSPSTRTLMSPRMRWPLSNSLGEPPNMDRASDALTCGWP